MPESERYAARAARLLRQRAPGPESRTSRDVGVSVVAQAIASRRRRRMPIALGALGLAAAVAAFVFSRARPDARAAFAPCHGANCASASAAAAAAPPVGSHPLSPGDRLTAPPDRAATVVLETGTRISVDRQGAIECREEGATQRFVIVRGRAQLHVAKLHPGERFLVDTPDAEIEVRGTSFSVRLEEATSECAARTSVDVQEGVVEVRFDGSQALLHAGERWKHDCASPAAPVSAGHAQERAVPRGHPRRVESERAALAVAAAPSSSSPEPGPTPEPAASRTPVSALTEQNELYARAQVAGREGRSGEALAAYARLLELFPNGPLVESASVQRVRLLSRVDRALARTEAERYLARFPNGFARADMVAITREP